jgi:hypothetical protein
MDPLLYSVSAHDGQFDCSVASDSYIDNDLFDIADSESWPRTAEVSLGDSLRINPAIPAILQQVPQVIRPLN